MRMIKKIEPIVRFESTEDIEKELAYLKAYNQTLLDKLDAQTTNYKNLKQLTSSLFLGLFHKRKFNIMAFFFPNVANDIKFIANTLTYE